MSDRYAPQVQAETRYRQSRRAILIRLTPEEWEKGERLFGKGELPAETKRLLLAAINRPARKTR